ncbi:hypothetical protein E2P61_05750 [Candidatus Bathyarchaeota archaeon]|nr:hypothetical protein E2P61_05750 [Candidatus Bathyarchaeota archaeon]
MNPGPPAPQASVIIRQHGKIPMILDLSVVLDYGPVYEDYNNRIIKTLQQTAYHSINLLIVEVKLYFQFKTRVSHSKAIL